MSIIAKGADTVLKQKATGVSIDVGNYRFEVVLTFFIWAFAKLRSHRKYRAKFKKLNRLIFPL
jgi:hypothetical protein